jgi:hypothetical protein
MQMPTILESAQADIDNGHSVIFQLINTNESSLNRAMARMEEGEEYEDVDITPRDQFMEYIQNCFPIRQCRRGLTSDPHDRWLHPHRQRHDQRGDPGESVSDCNGDHQKEGRDHQRRLIRNLQNAGRLFMRSYLTLGWESLG